VVSFIGKSSAGDAYIQNNEELGCGKISCKAVPFCTLRRLPPKRALITLSRRITLINAVIVHL
jgi:hypothetical protein